jgi:Cu(I)/Ag(I) efflux system protein CusF
MRARAAEHTFLQQPMEITRMKTLFLAAVIAAAAAPALAQHSGHGVARPTAAAASAEAADGEIRRIDKARGTVLLRHGEIKSLNMGAMTMSFKLKDPAMAAGLKEGDKVRFTAEQKGDDFIVTSIGKAN